MSESGEPSPLAPTGLEIGLSLLSLLHLALVVIVVVRLLQRKTTLPHGLLGLVLLLFLPVVGPLLILTLQVPEARHRP